MLAIIIIGIIIFLIASSTDKKKSYPKPIYTTSNKRQIIKNELGHTLLKNVTLTASSLTIKVTDDSITDVTDEVIENIENHIHTDVVLPYHWKNKNISSFNDIYSATKEQRDFYTIY